MRTKSKLTSLLLIPILLVAGLLQTGCSDKTKTTLDGFGRAFFNIATGFEDQVLAFQAGGVDPAKLKEWEKKAVALKQIAQSTKDFLATLKEVNEKDAAAVTQKVANGLAIIQGLLLNPDILGLGESNAMVQTLRYGSIALNQLSTTLAVFFPQLPPGTVGVSSTANKVVAIKLIEIDFTTPPPVVAAMLVNK